VLFNISHVVRTLTAYVQFSLSYVENALFCSDSDTKTVVPLLHCSINDTLIGQVPHYQNVLTKLTDILDLTFVPVSNFDICCFKASFVYIISVGLLVKIIINGF